MAQSIKTPAEIDCLRKAAQLSSEVHTEWMKLALEGMTERALAQWIDDEFRKRGMRENAYPTIVGSAERAMILHAEPTERVIQAGDLVLVDAGGKSDGYCSDITRVRAACGRMSIRQSSIYAIVLEAQLAAIAACRPGRTLEELHEIAKDALVASCIHEGFVSSREEFEARGLFPHRTSHWIGREVHDLCDYRDASGAPVALAEGMVFTIEPGLYFDGIGVRTEDMVLITRDGHEVLTHAPK